MKQAKFKISSQIQLREKLGILAFEMCISIGKYTVNGQNAAAPIKPKTLLKTGNIIATTVVNITNTVLHINRNKFMLKIPTNGMTI